MANDIVLEKKMQIQSKATYLICKKKNAYVGYILRASYQYFLMDWMKSMREIMSSDQPV